MNAPIANPDAMAGFSARTGSDVRPKTRATDKSVRDAAVNVKLVLGQIVVENKINGVLFSFPAAVWPDATMSAHQRMWIERLTPWWDMEQPQWSPTSHRLRESVVKAINKLFPAAQLLTSPFPAAQSRTRPSVTEGRPKAEAAALRRRESQTTDVTRHPNDTLCRPAGGAGGAQKELSK
mgnify:CR=1 FL=1